MRNEVVGERLELERFLPYRLSVLTNRISATIARQYASRFDLTPAEWRVMAALGNTPGLSSREVAERTAMDKVQVSRAVARLQAAGRLTRTVDASDSRIARLALSTAGRAVYRKIVPTALQIERRLMTTLSNAERDQLDTLLVKLNRQVDALVQLMEPP